MREYRLGRGTASSRLLRSEQDITRIHRLPELNDAFMEGMSLLQNYPIQAAGGVDRILQTASDLLRRRLDVSADTKTDKAGLGMRIRDTMWKGFTNQLAPPAESPEYSDDDSESSQDENNETETLSSNKPSTFTSRLATTVWKGITNQSVMEPSPSPPTPSSPVAESPLRLPSEDQRPPNVYNDIWSYAEKLKDSDTVAALSKVSSNWKARALIATRGHSADHQNVQESQDKNKVKTGRPDSLNGTHYHSDASTDSRRSSVYSPPPRPAYFRSPRDSYTSSDTDKPSSSHTNIPPTRSSSDLGIISKTRASLTALISPPPKSAPRSLVLSSASLITPSYNNSATSRHPHSAPALGHRDWSGDPRATLHRDSLSSVSSVSTPEPMNQLHRASVSSRDSDTDGTSRRILLNRKSVSPLYKSQRPIVSSRASSVTPDVGQATTPNNFEQSRKELECTDIQNCTPGSPLATSPPVPHTPSSIGSMDNAIHITEHEKQRGSVLLDGSEGQVLVTMPQPKRFVRKKAATEAGDTTDSSIASLPTRNVRVRTRRHQAQPAGLRLQAEVTMLDATDLVPSPNALRVEWPTEDQEMSVTPKASEFDLTRRRSTSPKFTHKLPIEKKLSGDGRETRIRKVSGSQANKKTSIESRETLRNSRDSAAEEGDDEGYDDLLSAYESEENVRVQIVDSA